MAVDRIAGREIVKSTASQVWGVKERKDKKLTPRMAFQMTKKIGFYDQLGTPRGKMRLKTDYLDRLLDWWS